MEVLFSNPFDKTYDSLEGDYNKIAKTTFEILGIVDNYEIDVSLVDEDTIHTINRDYRKVDRVTDVISFAFNDDKNPEDQIVDKTVEKMLGEILICLPRALEQAKEIGNTPHRELCFLFTHGLLHLLGYDHMKKEDEEIMFPLQDKILGKVGI
jgi:probable rRNA maturation factor